MKRLLRMISHPPVVQERYRQVTFRGDNGETVTVTSDSPFTIKEGLAMLEKARLSQSPEDRS